MKRMSLAAAAALALAFSAGVPADARSAGPDDSKKVTIIGCAVRGDGDGDGFLLANAVEETTRTVTTPGATGTTVSSSTTSTLKPSRILYWLDDDDDDVQAHFGHQVEVVGEVEGEIEQAEVEVEREDDHIEVEIKADGRKTMVRLPDVPSAVGTSGSVDDDEVELKYTVRKLDVKSVRMIASTCQ